MELNDNSSTIDYPLQSDEALRSCKPVFLADLEQVQLFDRIDTKFAFSFEFLPGILRGLHTRYHVLDVMGKRSSSYESLYFDTENFDLYNDHYCGKLNRYKVRLRRYADSGLMFFEVKKKNNKFRTTKERIRVYQNTESLDNDSRQLLLQSTGNNGEKLQSKLWVNYKRITLVSPGFNERVTIDHSLEFISGQRRTQLNGLVIAEVKQERSGKSHFIHCMKNLHIRSGSLSKYCYGIALMFPHIRQNNFKPQIHTLNKIMYGVPARSS